LLAAQSLSDAMDHLAGDVDMVVGPKSAPLDLILCCALHVTDPQGLVPLDSTLDALRGPFVRRAVPLALGDNVSGLRIVGTSPDILSFYGASLAAGRMWTKPLQAVLGARAARALHAGVGATLVGAHGLGAGGELHDAFPYTVTGILAPTGTVIDRLVLTDIESVFVIHRHETEDGEAPNVPRAANAVLVKFRSAAALASLPRMIDASPDLSAASPSLVFAKLRSVLEPAISAATVLGGMIIALAAVTTASSMIAGMSARSKDLALLRVLGAHPSELAMVAMVEAGAQAGLALLAGGALAYGVAKAAAAYLAGIGLVLSVRPRLEDLMMVVAGVAVAAGVAALIPAVRASQTPVEGVLA
jgi:putative ABC transport system permease protein